MNTLGEIAVGESTEFHIQVDDGFVGYIYGLGVEEKSLPTFIHGDYLFQNAFFAACFIDGKDEVYNTEQGDWGTEAEADAEIAEFGQTHINHIYQPMKAYMNGVAIPSLTDGTSAYIVMFAQLMDVPTLEGRDNEDANLAIDYGPHQNHMRLYRKPLWVDRPTP